MVSPSPPPCLISFYMYIYRLRKKKQNFPQTAEQPPGVQESRLSRAPSLSAVAQAWIHIGIKLKIFSHFLYIWKKIQPSCWKDALFKGLPDGCKASHRQTTSFTRLCHESSKIFTFIPMCNFSLLALGNPACHVRYLSLSLSLSLSIVTKFGMERPCHKTFWLTEAIFYIPPLSRDTGPPCGRPQGSKISGGPVTQLRVGI